MGQKSHDCSDFLTFFIYFFPSMIHDDSTSWNEEKWRKWGGGKKKKTSNKKSYIEYQVKNQILHKIIK
jgi:hypothetical protein